MKYFLLLFLCGVAWTDDTVNKALFVRLDHKISTHISPFLHSTLSLRPGDLKLFTGHAFNMIKTKCPAVDSTKLFQLQKYIGKMIAKELEEKKEQVQGESDKPQFKQLLESMVTCAKTKEDSGPVKNLRKNLAKKPFGGVSFIVRNPNGDLTIVRNSGETKKEKSKSDSILGFQDEPVEEGGVLDLSGGSNPKVTTTQSPGKKSNMDTLQEWTSSVLDKVGNFFSTMFGPGRVRRSTDTVITDSESSSLSVKKNGEGKWIHLDKVKGKEAVHTLMDQVCRLYCSKCHSPFQIQNFKMAAKELTDFVVKDENFLIVASHVLDDQLLKSIKSCGPHVEFVTLPI